VLTFIFVVFLIALLVLVLPLFFLIYLYRLDKNQKQHSVLRNYPLVGRVRYFLEHVGIELRQYLFEGDNEGKPFSRTDFKNIVLAAKYIKSIVSFGTTRDYEEPGYYIKNSMFPLQMGDLKVNNSEPIITKKYAIDKEGLFSRKEHAVEEKIEPWLLKDEDAIIIGPNCPQPFKVRSMVGMSGMSYGSLGENAISALSYGLGMAKGAWMCTGEGGLSKHHLKGNVDIIMQIGPGLFGVRDENGELSEEKLKEKASLPQIKAFEIKIGQGAKIRGGILLGEKVTPEIALIRGVEPWKTVESPNRCKEFHDVPTLIDFIEKIRNITGKPVGIKLVVGGPDSIEELAMYMVKTNKGPDFITVDGGEGGSGASYSDMMDSMGLPLKSALTILHQTLIKYKVRDRVKIIASGKLFTADRMAIALGMGADLINVARGFMISVGCIGTKHCSFNNCPVGVATTNPELQKALVVDEKKYRVLNYLITMRHGLFTLAAASGLNSPIHFTEKHVMFKDESGMVSSLDKIVKTRTDF
jgi:glutamate synthase domain-containing protein 2